MKKDDLLIEHSNYIEINDGGFEMANRIYKVEKVSPTLRTSNDTKIAINNNTRNLTVRRLTPRECFRLQGVKDEDYNKLTFSDNTLYHLAGDSIVVNVLMEIFKEII